MNKLSLRREALLPRIDGIQKNLVKLQEFSKLSLEDFSREENLDRVHHHLRLALEGVFNIASHVLARIPGGRETEYKRMARKLGELGIMEAEFAEKQLVQMAGYRNRLTHFYADVKTEELYEICGTHLNDVETFLGQIKQLLENPGKFGLRFE